MLLVRPTGFELPKFNISLKLTKLFNPGPMKGDYIIIYVVQVKYINLE